MRIGLLRDQHPFAEYDPRTNCWRIWYIFNNDVTSGTYYELHANGLCDRVTVRDRDIVSVDRVATPAVELYKNVEVKEVVVVTQDHIDYQRINQLAEEEAWQRSYEL